MTTTIMTAWERHLPFYTSPPVLSFKHVTQLLQPLIWMWTPSQSGWELHILPGIKESVSQKVVGLPTNTGEEEACSPKGSQAYRSAMGWDGRKTERNKKVSFKRLFTSILCAQWFPPPQLPKASRTCISLKRHLLPRGSERPTHCVPQPPASHEAYPAMEARKKVTIRSIHRDN